VELIKSDDDQNSEPAAEALAEAKRPLTATSVETHRVRPSFLRWLAGIVVVVVLAFLIILLARWIYHVSHHNAKPAPANTKKLPTQPSGSLKNQAAQKPQSGQPNSGGASTSGSSNSSNSPNSNLPNSGPGDVAAIFVGSGLAAGGLHFIWSVRRSRDY